MTVSFKTFALCIGAAVALTACDSFLNIEAEGSLPSTGIDHSKVDNVYKPVSAVYAQTRSLFEFNYLVVGEISSDDSDKGSTPSDSPSAKEIDEFKFTPKNDMINSYWVDLYNVISAANYAIEEMPKFEAEMKTDELKAATHQYAAEARVWRAWSYFMLTKAYGRVPLITHTMSSDSLNSLHQSSVREIYDFVEQELSECLTLLPKSYPAGNDGRINYYTALAILAKVYLYDQKYSESALCCDKIIASGQYDLMPTYRDVFLTENNNSRESLFEAQSSTLGQTSGDAPYLNYAYYQGPRNNEPSNMQGWGFKVPSNSLITFMTNRGETERMKVAFLYRGTVTEYGDSIMTKCTNPVYNGKVYSPSAYNTMGLNSYGRNYNIRLIRYAEILLIMAEDLVQGATGEFTSGMTAQSALDKVRARVNLPSVSASLENIYDERRAELCMEEDRFFDLVRTGRAAQFMGPCGFKAGKNEVFPVPYAQRQLNPNLEPTPGYVY